MCVCVCVLACVRACMCVCVCVCVRCVFGGRGGGYTMRNSGNDQGLFRKDPFKSVMPCRFPFRRSDKKKKKKKKKKQERLSVSSKKSDIYVGKLDA